MTHKNVRLFLSIILLIALVSLACGLGGAVTGKVDEAKQTVEAAATQAATAVAEVQQAAEAAATQAATAVAQAGEAAQEQATTVAQQVEQAAAGEGEVEETSIELNSVNASLDQLTSYRSKLFMSYQGTTTDNQPTTGQIDMFIEQIKEPQAMHMSMKTQGDAGGQGSAPVAIEIYEVDGALYMQNPDDNSWMSFPSSPETEQSFSQGFFSPDELVELPQTARRSLLPQDVNGISTWHYTFNEKDLLGQNAGLQTASGEIWIARDGGYAVKYSLDATGAAISSGQTGDGLFAAGTFHIEYELLEANTNFSITVPEEARNASIFGAPGGDSAAADTDLPIMPDAEEKFVMQGLVNYYTHAGINEVVDFYRAELSAQGWTPDTTMEMVNEDSALLQFGKDNTQLMLSLSREADGRVGVNLILTEQ